MSSDKNFYKPTVADEDVDSLSVACFQISSEVELKEIPSTGEEYLLKVMKERENYSTITKSNKDYSKFAKNQSRFIQEAPIFSTPEKFKPTIEWQNLQVADFSDIRMYISRIQVKRKCKTDTIRTEMEQNNLIGWRNFFAKNEPTLTCLLGLKSAMLDCGLESMIEMLGDIKPGDSIDHKTGQWIYSFLACTRLPLLSDTTSILRSLARRCAEIRSHLNPNEESSLLAVAPLNVFICIISRYFRQYDLAD